MNPDVLAILITVRNANAAINQVNQVRASLDATAAAARKMAAVLGVLYVATRLLVAIFHAAGEDDTMYRQLMAVTHSASIAQSQLQAIRAESDRGLFDKDELFQARKIFDETGASIKQLLPLAEELALRSGKGLEQTARVFGSLQGDGIAKIGAILRAAGITVNQLRDAGIDVTRTFQVKGSPQEVLAGLQKILAGDNLAGGLGGGIAATFKGVGAALTNLFASLGNGLFPVIKPALVLIQGMLRTLTWINDITKGWLGNIVLAVGALKLLAYIVPIIKDLAIWERVAATWAIILEVANSPWKNIATAIGYVIEAIKALASVEKLAAAWAAILDALDGNWVALGVGATVAAAVGVAWYFGNREPDEQNGPAAERPNRRSDLENQFNRSRARAFA